MLTFEEEILSKPVGQQGQAIIKRLERLLNKLKEEKEEENE